MNWYKNRAAYLAVKVNDALARTTPQTQMLKVQLNKRRPDLFELQVERLNVQLYEASRGGNIKLRQGAFNIQMTDPEPGTTPVSSIRSQFVGRRLPVLGLVID